MTSQINPNNINGAYPVAGQDNNSQGFRDNFTNTSQNFTYAAAEITDLQNKAVLKSALTGGTLNNDMLNAALTNALIADFAASAVPLGNLTGTVAVDYAAGHYYTVGTAGSLTLSFTNWPTSGQYGLVTVQVTVSSTAYTLTLPVAVTVNTAGIQGLNTSTNIMTFAATGVYTFTFTTSNGGATVSMSETNKQLQPYNASSDAVATTAAASLATTTSYFTTAGTATLAAGVAGQIKVLAQTTAASMVVTVATPGWTGSGTVTLASQGSACTLQYVNSTWICIGNNGAVFG
jgi:hypothetical protein